ncbi:MAG TPA: YjbH domain-containing protein [Oleiagrimonas sp.]|nr:YjbH domain-containing protein [Oleiagrimonas sp.]
MKRTRLAQCLLPLLGLTLAAPCPAQSIDSWTQGDYGGVGLLQTPTARMAPAGEFSLDINRTQPYTRYGISVQPFSWLEGTLRYTNISNRRYGPESLSGDQSYKDKAVDVKLRLWRESRWWPALAIGARDVGGTSLFSGEYVVASKRFGAFDVSMGLGWGYIGARGDIHNPFGWIDDRFNTRPVPTSDVTHAGEVNAKHFFRGPVALFGGVEYQTPWAPLRLKLEYDGNNYQHEPKDNNQKQDSPFNLGLVYRLNDNVDFSVGVERGNTALLGFTLHANFGHASPAPKLLDPPPELAPGQPSTTPPDKADWAAISQRLHDNAGYAVSQVSRRGRELYVTGEQERFYYPAEGVGRASRILDHALGPGIDWFTLVDTNEGLPVVQTSVHREPFKQLLRHDKSLTDFRRSVQRNAPATEAAPSREVLYSAPLKKYQGGVSLALQKNIGGPDAFVLYRLNANYDAEYHFTRHLWLSTTAQFDLVDNYDKFTYDAPSNLPRVRTHVREYLTTSRLNLPNLQLNYARRLAPDWYGMIYGGLLESMYGGAGGEVLYRPFGLPWAVSANVNWVRQRGFSQHFGFRDYHVVTGHVTAYIKTGVQDVLATVSAGRYLAGDWGGTLNLSRVFDNGVRMGVWATFTNVSRKQFGEGSFDKGFYISIPFDLMMARSTRMTANLVWQPLIRDGGAMLARRYDLYGLTSGRDPRLFDKNFELITQ